MGLCLYISLRSNDLNYHSTDDWLKGNDKYYDKNLVYYSLPYHYTTVKSMYTTVKIIMVNRSIRPYDLT